MFGMYTEVGDEAISRIVEIAELTNMTWPQTYAMMQALANANPDYCAEAMDTVVRENVYKALNYNTDFYC